MVMCSRCHKRVATVFVTKVENGERKTEGFCIKCAGELGLPTDQMMGNVMGKLGITPEQLENVEEELSGLLSNADLPSNGEDGEDGGAPAIDFPRIFRESGLLGKPEQNAGQKKDSSSAKNPDKTAPERKRLFRPQREGVPGNAS